MLLVHVSWLVCTTIAALGILVGPVIAMIVVKRKLHVPWRYFGFGALIFFLFQVISRVPIIEVLTLAVGRTVNSSVLLFVLWALFLGLTAGLCEEWGRYLGYRWFLKREPKTWNLGVAYGLGHASLEAILLVGVGLLVLIIEIVALSYTPATTASQKLAVTQIVSVYGAQPDWWELLALWERVWAMCFHVAMSVLVLQSIRLHTPRFVWLAVLAHTLLDTLTALLPHYLGHVAGAITTEGLVAIAGLFALWLLRCLRRRMREEDAASEMLPDAVPNISEARG
ncbi:YhfC family glutamic-type intramembrane protease [Ktedonobacter robiniae]|nr:YhfC family glutamic-type intramembrane protease [Ktedonobacter robiniae]